MEDSEDTHIQAGELSVSFGYQFGATSPSSSSGVSDGATSIGGGILQNSGMKLSSSFSCLSGAALSANATLANTNICNGLLGGEILPSLDSPTAFRRIASSSALSRLDFSPSSSHGSMSAFGGGPPIDEGVTDCERNFWKSMSYPTRTESSSFLDSMDLQMAGGAAGEDRVQAVCSEGNGWLFCGIYDGFNGRDAADFLAGTLYENVCLYLHMLVQRTNVQSGSWEGTSEADSMSCNAATQTSANRSTCGTKQTKMSCLNEDSVIENFHSDVVDCLTKAVAQAENDFMHMVEQEMEDRPDLVSVGSCVLTMLLYGDGIYILSLGDSRAILATSDISEEDGVLKAVQLTETHSLENELECRKVIADHPEDPSPIIHGRVKGRLKLTRAIGVGYLKKSNMNNVLMGILRVRNLSSPPYVYNHPFTMNSRVSEKDRFIVLGSDGLFDFFSNDEVVQLVYLFILNNPSGDPAKHLIEQLIQRAAEKAGFSTEDLMRVPAGRRRKYHDDVTVIVVILGNKQHTSAASTSVW